MTRAILPLVAGSEQASCRGKPTGAAFPSAEVFDSPMGQAEQDRFGVNLRLAREALGFSQRELSKMTGVHQPDISAIEAGKANPTLSTMTKLATAVGKDIHDLLAPTPT